MLEFDDLIDEHAYDKYVFPNSYRTDALTPDPLPAIARGMLHSSLHPCTIRLPTYSLPCTPL